MSPPALQLRKWIRNYEASQPPGSLGSKRPACAPPPSNKKQRRGGPPNLSAPDKCSMGMRDKCASVPSRHFSDNPKLGFDDGADSDGSTWESNYTSSSPTSPTFSERFESSVTDARRVDLPLLARRNVSMTPDESYSYSLPPWHWQGGEVGAGLMPFNLNQSVHQQPKLQYNPPLPTGPPVCSVMPDHTPLLANHGADFNFRPGCPATNGSALLGMLGEDPVEEWVDEWCVPFPLLRVF